MKERDYLGIDIGGTNTRFVLLRGLRPQRVPAASFPTPRSRRALEALIVRRVRELAGRRRMVGIGVGVAGVVNREQGAVVKAAHLPFLNRWNVRRLLQKQYRIPVGIDNDVRCFLRAEATWGAARGRRNVIALAIGTGIGGGIMVDGRVVYGRHDSAGEVGHMVVAGGKTFEQLGALAAFRRHGDRSGIIGIGVANLINAFDPEIVVLGGGGMTSGGVRLPAVRRTAKRYIIAPAARRTPIVRGILGDAAQAIGAALLSATSRSGK